MRLATDGGVDMTEAKLIGKSRDGVMIVGMRREGRWGIKVHRFTIDALGATGDHRSSSFSSDSSGLLSSRFKSFSMSSFRRIKHWARGQ